LQTLTHNFAISPISVGTIRKDGFITGFKKMKQE
jgi:hypothetical protein